MMTTVSNKLTATTVSTSRDDDFDTLFLRHYDRVYGLLYRLVGTRAEAEDLAQEVFLRLYQNPPRRRDSNIGAWLYRVATNSGYNAIRGRNRRWQRNLLLVKQPQENDDPQRQAEVNAEKMAVRTALATLSPRHGQLLLLRQMGLSYAELATACDMNPASVGKTLSRAADAFRAAYLAATEG
ncbi:MAG: sigma-70 family RNA polymerase sigma factor [Anaerolineae bacterium]|nr:sigma-70 family RNA polymerase sigma factor [Anaerolineae bacterium]MCO5193823.1 sigma-70 family RNA polymerase sigma factor [Anaerolineae bacterium]